MQEIKEEFEKCQKKHKISTTDVLAKIDVLLECLDTMEAQQSTTLDQNAKKACTEIIESHKDAVNAINKLSKTIEKHKSFKTDLDSVWDPHAVDGKEDTINEAIYEHLIRQGQFKVAEVFKTEGDVKSLDGIKSQFVELYQIIEEMKKDNLDPAINWCEANRERLEKLGSTLEFQLHRTRFISLMRDAKVSEALAYAKIKFQPFSKEHLKEIQKLMGSVLFNKRLTNSPYSNYTSHEATSSAQQLFTKDFCLLLGLSSESPLYTVITIGATALPTIIKMTSILKGKSGVGWSQDNELPVEIPLLDEHRYHSVFICPVSKEQATEENPAMLMACGHVVVKESLNRLSKGNPLSRFKCPYCPVESTASQGSSVSSLFMIKSHGHLLIASCSRLHIAP